MRPIFAYLLLWSNNRHITIQYCRTFPLFLVFNTFTQLFTLQSTQFELENGIKAYVKRKVPAEDNTHLQLQTRFDLIMVSSVQHSNLPPSLKKKKKF